MADRAIRSLEQLQRSASTARVLNLWGVSRRMGKDPDYAARPLFHNPTLNTSIIVKQRIHRDEADFFATPRRTATKILIPIEQANLRVGARYVFIGQKQFDESLFQAFGLRLDGDDPDVRTLKILDQIPSLDPFLLREQLRRHEIEPAPCYFDISPADSERMFEFVQREIAPLIRMVTGGSGADGARAVKLTSKILTANAGDPELEPLRLTLQLESEQYREGMFCWKAFLYYKWQLAHLLPLAGEVLHEIGAKPAMGRNMGDETKAFLQRARVAIRRQLPQSCRRVKDTLGVYDAAYRTLTEEGRPGEFREFLLRAPRLFSDLGERLGGVEHIVSVWRFRFPKPSELAAPAEDLEDMFHDFMNVLDGEDDMGGSRIETPVINAA